MGVGRRQIVLGNMSEGKMVLSNTPNRRIPSIYVLRPHVGELVLQALIDGGGVS
jgi:hypothetical protein